MNVLVIGGGLSGLAAGALLAREGARVRVIEANPRALGGHARIVDVDGVGFCAGPQYVWSFDRGGVGDVVLRSLGLDGKVRFRPMDPTGFERVVVLGEEPFDVPMDLEELRASLTDRFPGDGRGIARCLALVCDIAEGVEVIERKALYLRGGTTMKLGVAFSGRASLRARGRAIRCAGWSLGRLFDHCGLGQEVRRVLFAHSGIFAESASDLSAVLYSIATVSYHRSAAVPVPGFGALTDGLAECISTAGGSILLGRRVTRIDVAAGRARSVRVDGEEAFEADWFVSNLAPRATAQLLGGDAPAGRWPDPGHSLLCLYLVVEDRDREVRRRLAGRNLWIVDPDEPLDFAAARPDAPPSMLYVGSPSANGQIVPGLGDDRTAVTIYAPAGWRAWEEERSAGRDPEVLRGTAVEAIWRALDRADLGSLRERAVATRALAPPEIQREVGSEAGNVYGRRLTAEQILRASSRRHFPPNLVLGSASVGLPGVATAMRTGAAVAEGIVGRPLWSRMERTLDVS